MASTTSDPTVGLEVVEVQQPSAEQCLSPAEPQLASPLRVASPALQVDATAGAESAGAGIAQVVESLAVHASIWDALEAYVLSLHRPVSWNEF